MPRFYDPDDTTEEPAYAFASTAAKMKGRRRRKKPPGSMKITHVDQSSSERDAGSSGEHAIDWVVEEDSSELDLAQSIESPLYQQNDVLKHPPTNFEAKSLSSTTDSLSPNKVSPLRVPHKIRHAFLVDSRGLDTEDGNKIAFSFLSNVLQSLSRLARRGAAPLFLGCTCIEASSNSRMNRNSSSQGFPGATARKVDQDVLRILQTLSDQTIQAALQTLLPVLSIQPPLNAGNVKQNGAVKLPMRLLANATWKIFVSLVEVAVAKDKKIKDVSMKNEPLDLTIFTNDVASFCDTNEEAHQYGVSQFWNRVRDFFQNGSIRSIEIIVCLTGSIRLMSAAKQELATEEEHLENMDIEPGHAKADSKREIEDCVAMINKDLFKHSKSDLSVRGMQHSGNPVAIKLSISHNNLIGFNSIECGFIRRIFSRHRATVKFELPESEDGTQCAICLEAKYKIMPFKADSAAARGLMVDLQLLTSCKFEVVQLVPLSCVDGSLMFGTPLVVTAAFDDDLSRYTEMKALLSVLLHHLCDKDCVMLLRSTDTKDTSAHIFVDPLYHSDDQTFILMAEEVPGQYLLSQGIDASQPSTLLTKMTAPSEAIMFRYATSEQVIDFRRSDVAGNVEGDKQALQQLWEYIESSLAHVESNAVNPLLVGSLHDEQMKSSDASVAEVVCTEMQKESCVEDIWDDTAGVGSRDFVAEKAKKESPCLRCSLGEEKARKCGNEVVTWSRGDESEFLTEPENEKPRFDYDTEWG